MGLSEDEIIRALKPIFKTSDPRVLVGIGDDAAVVSGSSMQVLTTDMAVEGVHFRTDWSSAFEIGRKVTAANLADIYAMGAIPRSLLLALSLTGNEELAWIEDLARGVKFEADLGGAHITDIVDVKEQQRSRIRLLQGLPGPREAIAAQAVVIDAAFEIDGCVAPGGQALAPFPVGFKVLRGQKVRHQGARHGLLLHGAGRAPLHVEKNVLKSSYWMHQPPSTWIIWPVM